MASSGALEREKGYSVYKDTLRSLVLRILAEGPRHGYEIIKEIERITRGRWKPAAGTLYPLLEQLRNEGLIEVERVDKGRVRGGRKIVYRLTRDGWRAFASMLVEKARTKFEFVDFYLVGGARALREAGYREEALEVCRRIREGLALLDDRLSEEGC